MNFIVIEEGENIFASERDYNVFRKNNIWVENIEEILIPSVYGYTANFKRWKIIFILKGTYLMILNDYDNMISKDSKQLLILLEDLPI